MAMERSAQPTQKIVMKARCRHSVVQAQRDVPTGKAQCGASDTETRLALRRGSTLKGVELFSHAESAWLDRGCPKWCTGQFVDAPA